MSAFTVIGVAPFPILEIEVLNMLCFLHKKTSPSQTCFEPQGWEYYGGKLYHTQLIIEHHREEEKDNIHGTIICQQVYPLRFSSKQNPQTRLVLPPIQRTLTAI